MPRRRLEKARLYGPPSPRCAVCLRFAAECICARLPRDAAGVRVIIVQHAQELKNPSNTGRLVRHVLANTALVTYGVRGEPFDACALEDPHTDYVILFPRPGAAVLADALPPPRAGRTRALVVLDATWAKAQRMAQRIAAARHLPFARLPGDIAPRFILRKPPGPGQVGTAEATATALEIMGEHKAARTLMDALALIAEEVLKERGKTSARSNARSG
jgi:DTW domain-containing protein YfiP